ncbi:MAG: CRISPR-associated helicase Cas3' [Halanaerobiales bacterium]|nr:CRISPR-associated helicase Cas3' [Halanaerobiales bacterium]
MNRPIYSHPGKLLKDHVTNVMELGLLEYRRKSLNFSDLHKKEILMKVVLITHDFGKATSFFQKKLYDDSYNDERANHGLFSALFTNYILQQLIGDEFLSSIGFACVARHHGNLKNFEDLLQLKEREWNLVEEQFVSIDLEYLDMILKSVDINIMLKSINFTTLRKYFEPANQRRVYRKLRRTKNHFAENYLLLNMIFSILIFADKGEAIYYSNDHSFEELKNMICSRIELPPNLVDMYKEIKGWNATKEPINLKRNEIYSEIIENVENLDLEEKIFSVNVPTGTGKTLATLSAALHLCKRLKVETKCAYRIIYTLPFTSIIDQNYDVFQKVFEANKIELDEKVLLKHHYLTPKKYKWSEEYDDQKPDISEYMVEIWNSEIVVTTFVQLLHTIFSHRNRSLKKFHQLSNSIILLDEVQSIPYRYWSLVRETLKEMGRLFNCYFVLITATMPLIFDESQGEITELAKSKEDYFKFFDRIELNLGYLKTPMTLEDFQTLLLEDIMEYENKSFLVVLNTVGTSIKLYESLREVLDSSNLIYLSTNIIPLHRLQRIDDIKKSKEPKIIISTQMVEAGVDIDIDRVYRDFGPLDAINQTCGRCNRNFDISKKGKVTVVSLINENHNNKRYCEYVYSDILLFATEETLKNQPTILAEKEFYQMNKQYFAKVNRKKSEDHFDVLSERMKQLQYTLAFEDDRDVETKESKVFRLIDKDQDAVNLFIEIDERAQKIWGEYLKTQKISDSFARKAAFEKIKGDFLNYVITIPKSVAKKRLESSQLEKVFNHISIEQIQLYDFDTGFIRDNKETSSFF